MSLIPAARAQQTCRTIGTGARPACSKFPLALRFPVVMKDLRFLALIIKVICIELKIQVMEKL